MLKMTGVKLEQISDTDKYLFVKKGLKGGNFILLRVMLKQIINTWININPKTVKIYMLPWYEQFVWLGIEWISSLWQI